MPEQSLPLDGITVIELGHSIAAPYACEILGDLGADVIKIEKLDGDDARTWGPPFWGDASATFQSFNRNKRSVVVNLKDSAERERLHNLIIARADVVIANLRPGSASELGLDADALRRLKPSLIYCSIGAFGAVGPLKDRPGYDPLMQAFGGLMSVTGEPEQHPVRVGTSIIDMATGMWSVIGVLAALLKRRTSGNGLSIDTSLLETALGWMCYHAANYQASGQLPKRQGSGVAMIAPYRGYASKDGLIMIAAGNDKLFAALARALGHPEWIEDARFRSNPDRVRNRDALNRSIEELIATRASKEWAAILDQAGVPNAPMQTIADVLEHPQTKALGILQPSPERDIALVGLPLSLDGVRPAFRRSPPALGAHTGEIFCEQSAAAAKR
jgi:crotonobetainyl-CoA:carnitine CoA-transferase CaiB-like acyl-CoA transferase